LPNGFISLRTDDMKVAYDNHSIRWSADIENNHYAQSYAELYFKLKKENLI
jgi:hypothetical protein